jgi:hypothetical protein
MASCAQPLVSVAVLLAEEIFQDVRDGIRRNTSGGFVIHEIKLEKSKEGEADTYRALDWEPFEGSIASIPADITVGAGRSMNDDADEGEDPEEESTEDAATEDAEEEGEDDAGAKRKKRKRSTNPTTTRSESMEPKEETPKPAPTAAQLLQARTTEFVDTAALFGDTDEQKSKYRTMARTLALEEGKTLEDLKRSILDDMKAARATLANRRSKGSGESPGWHC